MVLVRGGLLFLLQAMINAAAASAPVGPSWLHEHELHELNDSCYLCHIIISAESNNMHVQFDVVISRP